MGALAVMWEAARSLQHKLAIGFLHYLYKNPGSVVMAAEHVIGWLHSCFFFFFIGPLWLFCPPYYCWPLNSFERKSKAVPGDVCKVVDLLLMIVYSKDRKTKKKKVGKFRKEKNKTQVVLSSPAPQVSHWNVSRSDDVVTFPPPVMTSQY